MVRHLTLNERRLREAERRVAVEAAEGARREVERRQALETAAPQVVKYEEAGQPTATGDMVGEAASETSLARRTRTGCRSSSSSGGEEERYLTISLPPTPGGTGESGSDTARPIAEDENRIEGRVLRGINNRVPSTNTSHRVGWVDASHQQERGKAAQPEQNLTGRPGEVLVMTSPDKEDGVGSPRDFDADRWQANDSEQENIALSEDTNRVYIETEKTASSVAESGEGITAVGSERLVQELRSTEEEVMTCLI